MPYLNFRIFTHLYTFLLFLNNFGIPTREALSLCITEKASSMYSSPKDAKYFAASFHSFLLPAFAVSPFIHLVFSFISRFLFSSFCKLFFLKYFSIGSNVSVFSPFPKCESITTLFFSLKAFLNEELSHLFC